MLITPIKTALVKANDDLFQIVADSVKILPDKSVLVISSKIISFCQGRIVEKTSGAKSEKHEIAKKEADFFLDPALSKYNMLLTLKEQTLGINAGIDESNADGDYVLWPENIQKTANDIWHFLRDHYGVKEAGVIVSDSKSIPLRRGVVGTAMTGCGFRALYDYRGKKDLFERKLKISQINTAEAIAVAAVLEMGEAAEQTPLCLVENIKKIIFQNRPPSAGELEELAIEIENDVYAPLFSAVKWQKSTKEI